MGQHRRRMGRRRRDLHRTIVEQQEYIALCERMLRHLSAENDQLLQGIWQTGSEAPTVHMPIVLEPPTHTIPIILPDGRVLRTEAGTKRPSWARKD